MQTGQARIIVQNEPRRTGIIRVNMCCLIKYMRMVDEQRKYSAGALMKRYLFTTLLLIFALVCFAEAPFEVLWASDAPAASVNNRRITPLEEKQMRKSAKYSMLDCAVLIATTIEEPFYRDKAFADLAVSFRNEPTGDIKKALRISQLIDDQTIQKAVVDYCVHYSGNPLTNKIMAENINSLSADQTIKQLETLTKPMRSPKEKTDAPDAGEGYLSSAGWAKNTTSAKRKMHFINLIRQNIEEGKLDAALACAPADMFDGYLLTDIAEGYYKKGDHTRALRIIESIRDPHNKAIAYMMAARQDPGNFEELIVKAHASADAIKSPVLWWISLHVQLADQYAEHGDTAMAKKIIFKAFGRTADFKNTERGHVCTSLRIIDSACKKWGIPQEDRIALTLDSLLIKYYDPNANFHSRMKSRLKALYSPSVWFLLLCMLALPALLMLIFGTDAFLDRTSGNELRKWLWSIVIAAGVLAIHQSTHMNSILFLLPTALLPFVVRQFVEKYMKVYKIKRGAPVGSDYWICPKCAGENNNLLLECVQCGYIKES